MAETVYTSDYDNNLSTPTINMFGEFDGDISTVDGLVAGQDKPVEKAAPKQGKKRIIEEPEEEEEEGQGNEGEADGVEPGDADDAEPVDEEEGQPGEQEEDDPSEGGEAEPVAAPKSKKASLSSSQQGTHDKGKGDDRPQVSKKRSAAQRASDKEEIDEEDPDDNSQAKRRKASEGHPLSQHHAPLALASPMLITGDSDLDSALHFKVVILDPKILSEAFTIIGGVIDQFPIMVENGKTFSGITLECQDAKHICMVQAKLTASVLIAPDGDDFLCISAKVTNSCLSSVPGTCFITMYKMKEDDGIYFSAYENDSILEDTAFRIVPIDMDPDQDTLGSIEYDYHIDMSLETVRKLVKNCKDLESKYIKFTVYESTDQTGGDTPGITVDKPKSIFVRIDINGVSATIFKMLHSITQWQQSGEADSGAYVIQTVEKETALTQSDIDKLQSTYEEEFPAEYFGRFIKSMSKQSLTLSLKKGRPMMILYPLGDEQSFIRFILAPKVNEDQQT